ncbi:MAG TPA: porin, partial [Salibaculum sp.]|nr:porin [Salibaculum sp.]
MKSILLASASVFAFAGAAAAEVSFSGDAELGYNDDDAPLSSADNNDGFYWEGNLYAAFSQDLDNGLTAGADIEFGFASNNLGQN